MSGFLRQEFRELEVLNYITKLRFEGKLEPGVGGNTRCSLIKSFQSIYKNYCPQGIHNAIKWSDKDPLLSVEEDDDEFVWQKADTNDTPTKKSKKRKREQSEVANENSTNLTVKNDIITDIQPPKKKKKRNPRNVDLNNSVRGMTWNADTWSCAYDSLLTILSNCYFTNTRKWNNKVATAND
ncbi:hypothetical protein DENSPDRAFT_789759, partial [Dentipellis sp. KUC8613]